MRNRQTVRRWDWRSHALSNRVLWGWVLLLSIFVIWVAGTSLGDFPHVSGDDAWIMSASHKLATEGVFGSDMYRGFAGADQHYFIALPVYHVLQAGVFAIVGTSVAAARAVTLASGLVALWCTAWLARRWHGVAVALIATGLLVCWRAYLLGLASGLSFISVVRTGRYDATALALVLLTLVGFELLLEHERRELALLVGVTAGLATLTQFFGIFTIVFIAIVLLIERGWRSYRLRCARWLAAGWLAVVIPYALYAALHWSDFTGQSELKQDRVGFDSPGFYVDNLLDEPDRYRRMFDYLTPLLDGEYHVSDRPLSPFLFGTAALLALGFLAGRLLRKPESGERRLGLALLIFGLSLALVDGTNGPVYAVVLLPLLCIAIALMAVVALSWAVRERSTVVGVAVALLVITPMVVVAREGVIAYQHERESAHLIVAYEDVTGGIDLMLPPGAPVLGAERWWAGLHETHDYIALSALARQIDGPGELDQSDSFSRLLAEYRIAAIVVDNDALGALRPLPQQVREQVADVLDHHALHAGTISMHPYGQIDVYVLAPATSP